MEINSTKANEKRQWNDRFCKYCKRKGHSIEECRSKAKANAKINQSKTEDVPNTDLIEVEISINNVPIQGLVDTGANRTIISPTTVNRCNLEILPSPTTVTLADGSKIHPIGVTSDTSVSVMGTQCKMDMMVMSLNYDALLGMDFLSKTGATIDITKKCLLFPEKDAIFKVTMEHQDSTTNEPEPVSTTIEEEIFVDEFWPLKEHENKPHILNENISKEELEQLSDLILKNKHCFATNIMDLGRCNVSKYYIKTATETPIFIHPYRKSLKERNYIQEEVSKMLAGGIIRESKSPWSSPVIMVKKPDGTFRFCTDYRQLNKITLHDPFPLPRTDDIFDRLSGSKWFSTLDLKSGYWQIELDEASIPKSAFSTPDGHYEYLRLPFGMKNAPAEFSRIMHQTLGNLAFVEIYLDDIIVHSPSFHQHLEHLERVFQKLQNADLKLNGKKCTFAQKTIHVLGHVISENNISVDVKKIEAIKEIKPPKTIKEVQRFLGMTSYYRKFIEHYAELASPLYHLLKQSSTWQWGDVENSAFETLKNKLISIPILRLPDLQKPFIIHTDASGVALGAILAQKDEHGMEYVCQYESRLLKGSEIHYGISEKECLGIVWAIRKFRAYIYGSKFMVVTDHAALQWLLNIKDVTGRLARWAIYLQNYEFEIIHRKGSKHLNVDCLSRPNEIHHVKVDHNNIELHGNNDPYDNNDLLTYLRTGVVKENMSDKQKQNIIALAEDYFLDKGDLYYKNKDTANSYLKVPRIEERKLLIEQSHLLGHFQEKTTRDRLLEQYYWPTMRQDIKTIINKCVPCIRHRSTPIQDHPAQALTITGLFDRVGIDCIFGLPETEEGYKGILVLTEYLSKFPYAVPIRSKSAHEIATHLFNYISFFGPPKVLLSDQGKEFLNEVVDQLSRMTGMERKVTSAYHPRTNGLTERFNQTLIQSLCCHADVDPLNWHEWVPYVLLAYRTRVQSSTGFSPFELLFGRKANHFSNWGKSGDEADSNAIFKRSIEIRQLVEDKIPTALDTIKGAQQHQKSTQNKAHRMSSPWPTGTLVFIRNQKLMGKLQPKFIGPYKIIGTTTRGNYWLENAAGNPLPTSYPITRLKKANLKDQTQCSYEVERILDHRVRNGRLHYFVKWKDYPVEDCTWEPEAHFDTFECIEEYWNAKTGVVEDNAILSARTCYIRIGAPHDAQSLDTYTPRCA